MATKIPTLLGGSGTEENTLKLNNLKSVIEDAAKNVVGVLRSIEKNTKASLNATRDLVKISKKPKQMTPTVEGPTATPQAVKEKPAGKPQEEGNAFPTLSAIAAGGITAGLGAIPDAASEPFKEDVKKGLVSPEGMVSRGEATTTREARTTLQGRAIKQVNKGEVQQAIESNLTDDELKQQYGKSRSELKDWLANSPKTGAGSFLQIEPAKKLPEFDQMGPPKSVFQAEQAQANQAADYAAAGKTMEAAGMSTVTGRKVANLEKGQMQPADYEQAQQAQAAREGAESGLRQRKGREGPVPIPSSSDTVEPAKVESKPPNETSNIQPEPKSRADRMQEQARKLIDTAREMGIQGKVQGKYEGGQLTKIVTEDGREIDVSGKLTPEQSAKVEAARKFKAAVDAEQPKPESVEPVPADVQPGPKGERRDIAIAKKEGGRMQEQARKLIDTAREMGIEGNVHGKYEGGQLTKIITEDGREIDVSGKLTPEQSSKVEAARKFKAAVDAEQVTQATNENRDLQRQDNQQSPQPIVVNNSNTVGNNNYIPTPASPRGNSPYDAYNNSRAAYR